MDRGPGDPQPNPALHANCFSKILFCWMNRLFREGNKRDLEVSDLYEVLPQENSELLGNKLGELWETQLEKSRQRKGEPSLLRAISAQFWAKYMLAGILAFFEECVLMIGQPILLGYLIRYFSTGEFSELEGWLFAGGVAGVAFVSVFVHHPYFFAVYRIGSQVRIASCSLIYRKALRLSQLALSQTTVGQMVNLLSNDVNRFDQSAIFLHYLWITPIQTVLVAVVLWQYFGPFCLCGIALLILFVPFQGLMGKHFSTLRVRTAEKTDGRIRVMNEFLNGIRVIKMYAWEIPFSNMVADSRNEEVKVIRRTNHLRAMNMGIAFISSKIIVFITLLAYVINGNKLTAEKVFVTLTLFNTLRVTVTMFTPSAVAQLAESLVSVKRLQKFLLLQERGDHSSDMSPEKQKATPGHIKIDHLTAKWNPTYEENTLSDINLEVFPGDLVAIVGHVGSGKTSLLQTILKELPPTKGQVEVTGSIGYAAQEPWLFTGSVRENILFGRPLDVGFYSKVIDACALKKDLTLLPYADATLLSDKGASLSGGQKARIALARAVYADADIYLLDDPLSAVDAEVGKHIFDKCVCGILKHKTRILVTHQLQFLTKVNRIILLGIGGKIEMEGTYEQLQHSGLEFAKLLEQEGKEVESKESRIARNPTERKRISIPEGSDTSIMRAIPFGEIPLGMTSHEEIYVLNVSEPNSLDDLTVDPNAPTSEPKAVDESRSSGQVPWSLYWKYFRSGSNVFVLFLLFLSNLIAQFLYTACDYWLNVWTKGEADNKNAAKHKSTPSAPSGTAHLDKHFMGLSREQYVVAYSGIIGIFSVFAMIRTFLFFKVCMDASVGLHNVSFRGIVRAPMKFFEVNPLGRVLNRFSKDLGLIDDALPVSCFDALAIFSIVIGIMILIGFVNPYLLLPGVVLAVIFWFLRNYYLKTARSVKRIEGIVRSPVFSHLSSSLYGLTTIRSYGVEDEFIRRFDRYQDLHSSAWFLFIASSRWFGIRLDLISVVFIAAVTFSFMFTAKTGSGPEVGLAISAVLALSGMFQWGVRQSAEVSNQMVSVERIMEYTTLTPEAPLESTPDKKPPPDWPSEGRIEMRNFVVHYAQDQKPALSIPSLLILPREKIGIVGRTGAGKSTILIGMFRIVEPSGQLLIDGVNVLEVGLHDLRSHISIIPQDPVLFTGSVRKNLDPFSDFTDAEVWTVLSKVNLAKVVKDIPGGLHGQITEGGGNFSLGERQLMCLGRAILKRNRILVLDEATASVDAETDAFIQRTIRDMFGDCTVLTIAHRLNTVMDSDRILVLEAGHVKEFDEPYTLLQNESGALYHLVKETGAASMENLIKIAKEVFERKRRFQPT